MAHRLIQDSSTQLAPIMLQTLCRLKTSTITYTTSHNNQRLNTRINKLLNIVLLFRLKIIINLISPNPVEIKLKCNKIKLNQIIIMIHQLQQAAIICRIVLHALNKFFLKFFFQDNLLSDQTMDSKILNLQDNTISEIINNSMLPIISTKIIILLQLS